jgi:hypothetical protein
MENQVRKNCDSEHKIASAILQETPSSEAEKKIVSWPIIILNIAMAVVGSVVWFFRADHPNYNVVLAFLAGSDITATIFLALKKKPPQEAEKKSCSWLIIVLNVAMAVVSSIVWFFTVDHLNYIVVLAFIAGFDLTATIFLALKETPQREAEKKSIPWLDIATIVISIVMIAVSGIVLIITLDRHQDSDLAFAFLIGSFMGITLFSGILAIGCQRCFRK